MTTETLDKNQVQEAHDLFATLMAGLYFEREDSDDLTVSFPALLLMIIALGNEIDQALHHYEGSDPEVKALNMGRLDAVTIIAKAITQVGTAKVAVPTASLSTSDTSLGGYL